MSMDPLKCRKVAAGIDVEEPFCPVSILKHCLSNRIDRAWIFVTGVPEKFIFKVIASPTPVRLPQLVPT
jgi:hypothetical protein